MMDKPPKNRQGLLSTRILKVASFLSLSLGILLHLLFLITAEFSLLVVSAFGGPNGFMLDFLSILFSSVFYTLPYIVIILLLRRIKRENVSTVAPLIHFAVIISTIVELFAFFIFSTLQTPPILILLKPGIMLIVIPAIQLGVFAAISGNAIKRIFR